MDHLKAHYRDSLTRRITALEAHRETLRREGDPIVAIAEIRGLAHTLKGSGATYGFANISKVAAAVEQAPVERLAETLDNLLAVLHQTVEEISSAVGGAARANNGE